MIENKDISGQLRFSTAINNGAKGKFTLMKEDYIILPFSVSSPIQFKLGDYVDLAGVLDESLGGKLGKIYEITDLQKPTYNTSTGAYDYKLQMNAYYWKWKNKIFKYTPEQAGSEASWSLTASLDVQLGVFLRNLKALGYTYRGADFTFSIDDTVENKAMAMTYDNMNLLDALFSMAGEDKWDCDCWITDNVIHFGRNEFGDAVKIERGIEASSITRSESQGTYATRIYAFGSTKNIPANYRPTDEQAVINGVVQKRLMLPADTPYIDAYEGMSQEEAIEDVVVFDDVYPRRVGTLSDVHTRTEEVENEDGTKETITYYRYKDTGLEFKDEYILEGQELKIKFQSGKLNGLEFGVIFNPEPKDESRGDQLWEIVRNEDYGRPLPDDMMYPADGDEYTLSGFDIQLVSDQYIPAAEQELKEKAQKYADKVKKDDGTYPTTLASNWVYEDPISRTYEFGQRVNLVDDTYFEGGRISRVLGWEMNLDIPWDSPVYTIGESMPYSRISEIEDKVDSLTYKGQTYVGGGGGVYLIKVNDKTAASDSNAFSALRSLKMFHRKDKTDENPFLQKFLGGLEVGEFNQGSTGVGVYQDDAGNWHIETDYLDVRLKFTATTVEIQKAYHIGGEQIKSAASMKCVRVEELEDVYRCYMNVTDDDGNEVTNDFRVNDQAYVNTFNLVKQADGNTGNHFLWRLVTAVGTNYIDLSKTVCAEQSDAPISGDEIVLLGYQGTDEPDRQVAVIDAGAGSDAPYYRQFVGINTFSLPAPETQLKPGNNELSGRFHIGQGSTGWENMDGLPEEIQQAADLASDAMEAADNAAELADGAAQVAADAQDRLDEWADDGIISPTEKLTLKQELSNLQAEFEANIAEAQKYGVDTTVYTSAWEKYKSELEYHCADTPENIEVKETFATSQAAFYNSRTSLLDAIADKAKTYVDDVIGGIQVGGLNLLLNSGFTGDYKSENLQTGTQLTENKEMYSDALKHWTGDATVKDDTESASGRSVVLGSIEQAIAGMIIGEQYVLSYKAKGVSVAIACGNFSTTQDLTSSYKIYTHKFTFQGTPTFSISGTSATLCMPQLERGTIATGWNPSPQDNEKWLAEFQTLKYLTDAIKNGSVDILGGLILANMVLVGNYKDGTMEKVTAGISGIYNDDDDVFTFGGGTLDQAIYTVMKYKENPMYQPTDEELLNMTKVVITHGGRAILNDVIVRGYIYALGGFFRGKVETFANGNRIVIDPTTNSLSMYDSNDKEVCKMCFRESGEYGSYPELTLTRKNKSGDTQSVSVYGTNVIARNENSDGTFTQGVLSPLGIEFFRNTDTGAGQDTAAQYLATPAVRVISEATYIQSTDEFLRFIPTGGITAYMPEASRYPGKKYYVKITSGSVKFTGSQFLNSDSYQPSDTYELTGTISIMMISDGTYWCIFYCG